MWNGLFFNYFCLDRITGLTGFFCIAGLYPVVPVDPVRKIKLLALACTLIRRGDGAQLLFDNQFAAGKFADQHIQNHVVIYRPHGFRAVAHRDRQIPHTVDNFFAVVAARFFYGFGQQHDQTVV